jgi:predicted aconitase with swiveling domain
MIAARVLHGGEAEGPVAALDEPLSLWGGFDPLTGRIVDVHHPQRGLRLTGAIVLMREARGSGSSPGTLAEAIRRGTAPAAIVLEHPDVNLAIGAAVAAELYGRHCPVLAVTNAEFERLRRAQRLRIAATGELSCESV